LKLALRPAASLALSITAIAVILSEALRLLHLAPAPRADYFRNRTLLTVLVGTLTVFCWELGRSLAHVSFLILLVVLASFNCLYLFDYLVLLLLSSWFDLRFCQAVLSDGY
jgi:hypothetical protein